MQALHSQVVLIQSPVKSLRLQSKFKALNLEESLRLRFTGGYATKFVCETVK